MQYFMGLKKDQSFGNESICETKQTFLKENKTGLGPNLRKMQVGKAFVLMYLDRQ